jgi:polar amino acid transport system substrate-binding protein
MTVKLAGAVAALCICGAATGLAQTLPADIAASKTVRVAMDAEYPPLETHNPKTNDLEGFDVDLNQAIAKKLGVKLEFQDGPFEQMTLSLKSGRVDIIFSGFYDLPKRRGDFTFIDYLKAGGQFYKLKSDTAVKTATDLCGKTISTLRGTNYPDTTKAWSDKNCVAAGKPPITVILDSDLGQELANLKQGRADAAVQGMEAVPTIAEMDNNAYEPLGEPFSATLMGMAFTKTNAGLRDAYQAALLKVVADGDYAALIKKWKLDLSSYPDASVDKGMIP